MLWHVVITRFSYRHSTIQAGLNGVLPSLLCRDPLQPRRLAFRCAVFELTALPSLLRQTTQDFDWFIIVDRDLPQEWRDRLIRLAAGRARTHLRDYDPSEDLSATQWLVPFAPPQTDRLLTTLLDDDDALPLDFLEKMRSVIAERDEELAPIATLASRNCRQWELVHSARAPLGYGCAWHRGPWILTTGLSLLCRWPQHRLTVLAIQHQVADLWFIPERGEALMQLLRERWALSDQRLVGAAPFIAGRIEDFRRRVDDCSDPCAAIEDRALRFLDISHAVEAFVVSNHFGNDQVLRLFEPKPDRVPVQGSQDFPRVPIDWDGFRRNASIFAKHPGIYLDLLRELWSKPMSLWSRLRMILWATWRYVRA
ncbi:putative rhamnosyl transferase [Xanthomonas sacchari]|uniref:putative rhamnosyl transferase n=1 Tax=Xanthomonas sacchari TaxID=56458 RepID=UPI00224DFB36|nr:putative rhamnosyl transferase [Xanthomonas sacchari]MCW0447192.1 hypothetical protein [Xanthomonas sacchari]MCW0452904.1 hypothetical protein [Xanthomonas sacchari]UYK77838.1 putative rhamnosyl transferase [Xanthomonas sacchari]